MLCYMSSTVQEGSSPSIVKIVNGGPSPYPSYVTTMMGVKGIKKRTNEKGIVYHLLPGDIVRELTPSQQGGAGGMETKICQDIGEHV